MTNRYNTDNRYSPGSSGGVVPLGAPAAYAARWIDHCTWADILPDRQGFAYNDRADFQALVEHLVEANLAAKMPNVALDVTRLVIDDPAWCLLMRRAGGYVYVDAWLVPEHLVEVEEDDVEVPQGRIGSVLMIDDDGVATVDGVPLDWPVLPLQAGAPMTDTVATCGTCGRSWDDSVSTSMTPTPSGRCPFEPFHSSMLPDLSDDVEVDADLVADWQYEVANGDTVLGLVEWSQHKVECGRWVEP